MATRDNGYKELATAIVMQAIDDYNELKKLHARKFVDRGQSVSYVELNAFFKSDYCDTLLGNVTFTGKDILRILRGEPLR
jgi:hypothetical protein